MRLKFQPAFFVPIPILAIIAILIGGVLLIRLISGYIPSINAQISNKYLLPGEITSSSIDDASAWLTHTNDKYNYTIKYPPLLKGVYNYETNNNLVLSRERFISDKIDITVSVYSKFETKDLENSTKVGANTFLYFKNNVDEKGVVVNHNNLFYTIDFSQINYFTETPYFSSSTQFKEIFNLILNNFQFNG